MEQAMELTREVLEALGAPFPEDEIEFLPRAQSGGKALGLPYIDARSVMRRLDAVVGPGNWSFDFDLLSPDGKMVKGRLTVLGVTKCDAGEAAAEEEVLKSAVSDALKRCAVHFNIGRYLYYLPKVWAPFDPQKRRFTEPPRLDPAAVARALELCGVNGSLARRTPGAPSQQANGHREGRAPRIEVAHEAPVTAARKSIWAARPSAESDVGVQGGAPAAETAPAAAEAQPARPEGARCSAPGCGRPLTKGQHDVSVRGYGRPLCPACQKLHTRRPEATRA